MHISPVAVPALQAPQGIFELPRVNDWKQFSLFHDCPPADIRLTRARSSILFDGIESRLFDRLENPRPLPGRNLSSSPTVLAVVGRDIVAVRARHEFFDVVRIAHGKIPLGWNTLHHPYNNPKSKNVPLYFSAQILTSASSKGSCAMAPRPSDS